MRSLLFAVLILSLAVLPAFAQEGDVNVITSQIDELVPLLMDDYEVPGVAVVLIRDGAVVWSQGFGVANLESGEAVTPDTPFEVASISKALTAWQIMRMMEAGEIFIDAPANLYLRSWKLERLGRNDPDDATIRRLLSHTAGLSADGYEAFEPDDVLPTLPEFLDGATGAEAVQLISPAGRRMMYSGGGYMVLQQLIEDFKGAPFAEVMDEALFTPLGMENSSFVWSPELGAATSYGRDNEVITRVVHMDQAAGGLYTSANDLAQFLTAGFTEEWLTPETVALMHTAAEATEDDPYGFGFTVEALADGRIGVWHNGIAAGARSVFVLLPEDGDGIIILTNARVGNRVINDVVCAWDTWVNGEETELCGQY